MHATCISHNTTYLKFSKSQKTEHITSTEGVPALKRMVLVHFFHHTLCFPVIKNYNTSKHNKVIHIQVHCLSKKKRVSKKTWTQTMMTKKNAVYKLLLASVIYYLVDNLCLWLQCFHAFMLYLFLK